MTQWWYWALFALAAVMLLGALVLERREQRRRHQREREMWRKRWSR